MSETCIAAAAAAHGCIGEQRNNKIKMHEISAASCSRRLLFSGLVHASRAHTEREKLRLVSSGMQFMLGETLFSASCVICEMKCGDIKKQIKIGKKTLERNSSFIICHS